MYLPSLFMRLVGVNQLTAAAVSSAEERYTDVEVALVLDLSNSMNSFDRIQNLRDAGQEFLRVLFNNSGEDKVSLSVIPYTGQVNPGAALGGQFNVTFDQPFSHCMEFEAGAYGSLSLSPTTQIKGTGHFDPWHSSRAPVMFFCPTHPNGTGEIVPLVSEPGNTSTRIGNMIADGNTSIDIGVK